MLLIRLWLNDNILIAANPASDIDSPYLKIPSLAELLINRVSFRIGVDLVY